MASETLKHAKSKKEIEVVQDYDIAADAKNRISLRGARTKYFHVKALSNGSYVLEPRVLAPPEAISAPDAKMMEQSAAIPKKGGASARRGRTPSVYDLGRDLIGSIKGLPADIATNPKYMEGFGE